MKSDKSIFEHLFGEIGELIQFLVAFFVILGLFMVGPMLFITVTTHWALKSDTATKKYEEASEETKNLFNDITQLDGNSKLLESKINKQITKYNEILTARKQELFELSQLADASKLTPEQRKLLQNYQQKKEDNISFQDWIKKRPVVYDITMAFFISLFFYILGKRKGKSITKSETHKN